MNPWDRPVTTVDLVRTPVDLGKPWQPLQPKVDTGGHMALGTESAIAQHGDRGIASVPDPVPVQEFSAPAASNGVVGVLKAAEIPREVVAGTMHWLEHGTDKSENELATIDAADLAQTRTELEHLWGGPDKVERHVDTLGRYIGSLPSQEAEVIQNARDPASGRAYLNDPANVVRLAGLARAPQPAGDGPMTIARIEAFMRTNRTAYQKDEALQARYRQLLDEREQSKGG